MGATGATGSRRRAVRLTSAGLAVLQQALQAAWALEAGEQRMTRDDKARLLDVSAVTAHKILAGQGVDRATLSLAFKRLGAEWKDTYCEHVAPPLPQNVDPSIVPAKKARVPLYVWLYLIGVGTVCAFLLLWNRHPSSVTGTWADTKEYDQIQALIDEATHNYDIAKYEVAAEQITQAVNESRQMQNATLLAHAQITAGHIATERGDYEAARASYLEALSLRNALRQQANVPPLLESLGNLEALQGNLAEARKHLIRSYHAFASLNDETGMVLAARDLGSVATQAGDLREAQRWFGIATRKLPKLDKPQLLVDIRSREGELLRDAGRLDEARAIFEETYAYWKANGHPRWIAKSLLQLGSVECLAGNGTAARGFLLRSEALYKQVGDVPGVQNCGEWLKRTEGVPKPRKT